MAGESPIADALPDATVLFADLAGFTTWSAGRAPGQVLAELERRGYAGYPLAAFTRPQRTVQEITAGVAPVITASKCKKMRRFSSSRGRLKWRR